MHHYVIVFISLVYYDLNVQASVPGGFSARPLLPDKVYQCCKNEPYASNRDLPVIYCYLGLPKIALHTWQTVSAVIDLSPEQYDLYEGSDSAEVWAQFEAHRSSWSFNALNWRRKHIKLDPFNNTCLGIRSGQDYSLRLLVTNVDYTRVAMFSLGILLFFLSPTLADNALFYYLTGITVGMLASLLILFYFILKLLPLKKPAMLGMVAGGSTIALILFQTFYENILLIMYKYQEYVIGYLLLSALISFVVCYRFGPVSNPRSKNLIKWSLQAFALFLIFCSSHLQEFTLSANAIILFFYNVPIFRWIASFARFCARVLIPSRPRKRLLTLREYQEQGEEETAQGLDRLRDYCNSPDCRQWQTVLRLRHPHRFAEFMEGKSHLTKEEVEQYEEECKRVMDEILTDDSDED